MSYVTDAVIITDAFWGCPTDLLAALTAQLPWTEQGFCQLDDTKAGGPKGFSCSVFAAGFNYMDTEMLVDWFRQLPWGETSAVLTLATESQFHERVGVGEWA